MKDTHTPSRNFRAPDEEWLPAKAEAARRGETITDALRRFLREYQQGQRTARGKQDTNKEKP